MKTVLPEFIPFNRPFIVGKELFYISQAVLSGHLAGDGVFTRRCERWMEEHFRARKVLLTHSCTAALEMAAMLTGVGPGDEVILPSFTFVSTASAFVLRGASVRFVDIRSDTLNLDESLIEAAITKRTKVIAPMHYAGVGCAMDTITEVARQRGLMVVEDAAQGVDATWRGQYLGTLGTLGAYSFHETKNFISGEGGALVVNEESLIERAEIIREKGTDRARFFRGEIDKYTWQDLGSSYLPSEIVAAFLFAQLEAAAEITSRRAAIHDYYRQNLQPLEDAGLLRLPYAPPECRHNANIFYLILPDGTTRDGLLRRLRERAIHAVFHYVPLHLSPMGQRMGYRPGELPVTEELSRRILRLPCYFDLTRAEQDRVIEEVGKLAS